MIWTDFKQMIQYFKNIAKPNIWLLHGEVGAGKTTFVQQMNLHLPIISPSFTGYIVHDKVLHIDAYFTKNISMDLIREYWNEDYDIFIEWPLPQHIKNLKLYNPICLYISHFMCFTPEGLNLSLYLIMYIIIHANRY